MGKTGNKETSIKGKSMSTATTATKNKAKTIEEVKASQQAPNKEPEYDPSQFNNTLTTSRNDQGRTTGNKTPLQVTYAGAAKTAHKFVDIEPNQYGASSIINPYALFLHPNSRLENTTDPFFDGNNNELRELKRNLSPEKLLTYFGVDAPPNKYNKNKVAPYYANDFLYAKYFDLIPLNHLITLRRYPFPVYDSLVFGREGDQFRPIAQAITYFGEPTGNTLSDLLKTNGKITWESIKGPDFEQVQGNEQSLDNSPGFSQAGNKTKFVAKSLQAAGGKNNDLSGRELASIEYQNKVNDAPFDYLGHALGPVNVITETSVRGRGIGAEQEYSLIFEYQQKSYNGIDPKIALIDIMCNMLALCFNNAQFWGGANRYIPSSPQFGFFGDQNAFYAGDYGKYFESVVDVAKSGLGNIGNTLLTALNSILSGDLSSLKALAGKALGGVLDIHSRKSRPNIVAFKAILTGLPTGEWHITVGNPFDPIAMVGNLICTGFEFEWGDQLGDNDFPTDLKFKINLKGARARDKGDLESIVNYGQGRIYYPPEGALDVSNLSSSTRADGSATGNGSPTTAQQKKNQGGSRKYNIAKGSVY